MNDSRPAPLHGSDPGGERRNGNRRLERTSTALVTAAILRK